MGAHLARVSKVTESWGCCLSSAFKTGAIMATSPIAERRMTSTCCSANGLLAGSENWVKLIVVVHFHLLIYLHILVTLLKV